MRKLIPLLLLLLCLPLTALAAGAELTLTAEEMGFAYDLTAEGNEFVVLIWEGKNETGRQTLYSGDGHFTGRVALDYSPMGGKFTVTVQNLKQNRIARETVMIPEAAGYAAPAGRANAAVKTLTLEETPTGFRYSFTAKDTDYMLLYFRSKQQTATFPVYPVNDEGLYEGEVVSPLTYCRTQFTVQVRNAKGSVKKEATCRKAWAIPEAAQAQEGRLSGVVVCIDPGHQENGRFVTEPIGPGLSGKTSGKGGMAQGKVTLRKEDIVVLETAMRLRDILVSQGATVVLTRDVQDVFHTNIERCEIAAAAGAHVMLRLHCNNSSNANKTGIQIYSPLNSDYARAVAAPEEYRAMGETLLAAMKDAVGYEQKDATGVVRLNDNYVGNNWAQMACFLVEMGYMSNVGEDIKLATPEYQQMLAEGMAEGVYQLALMRGWIEPEATE
ncbi:MAG: N-acetylmuramoyl-L-alanine amidase [Clostridia bacterium]|nr:N-acetylmuramoyl-L-alanine amidase [Clostridia bacterium]